MSNSQIIALRKVQKSFKTGETKTEVLDGIDLNIYKNGFYIMFGPSGCGKTTFLNLIAGLDLPDSGTIVVHGQEVSKMSRRELIKYRRDNIGFVFQFYNLIPTLTALENVEAGLEIKGIPTREVRDRALFYIDKVSLLDKRNKFPSQLSGGEQQRVAIARAFAMEPRIILADEPTGNLDAATGEKVIQLMKTLEEDGKRAFIVATHNETMTQYADKTFHIANGQIG